MRSDVVAASGRRGGRMEDVSVHLDRPGAATVDRLFGRDGRTHLVVDVKGPLMAGCYRAAIAGIGVCVVALGVLSLT